MPYESAALRDRRQRAEEPKHTEPGWRIEADGHALPPRAKPQAPRVLAIGLGPPLAPRSARVSTGSAVALASGVLLGATNLFDENGDATLDRILNDLTFLGGLALIAALALVALGTAIRWLRDSI